MKINLSKSMIKCIEEMKEEATNIYKDIPNSQFMKLIRNPTKHKTFEFQVANIGTPMIKILINGRLYKNLLKEGNNWKEI